MDQSNAPEPQADAVNNQEQQVNQTPQPQPQVIQPQATNNQPQQPTVQPSPPQSPTNSEVIQPQPQAQPPSQQFTAANQFTASQQQSPMSSQHQPKKKKVPKALVLGILVSLALIGGSAAAYLGFILPNQPENIWKKALSNTADGYDMLVDYSLSQSEKKGETIEGNFSVTGEGIVGDGNISGQYYEKNSQGTIDVGFAGSRYEVELRTIPVETSETPDIYLKAKGIGALGSILGTSGNDQLGSTIEKLEDQWIFIDHTLIDQFIASAGDFQSSQPEITEEDMRTIAEKIGSVNRDYLLSDDPSRAVLRVVEEVGKEEYEGKETYKFKVGLNKENLKTYVSTLKTELQSTKLPEIVGGEESYNQGFDDFLKEIEETEADFYDNETADVWVDMKTKLIRNIRFSDKENNNNFMDVSFLYDGGSAYPFRIKLQDDEPKFTASVLITLDTSDDSLTLAADGNSQEDDFSFTGQLKLTPLSEPISIEKPQDAIGIMEVVAEFYAGMNSNGSIDNSAVPQEELEFDPQQLPVQLNSRLFEGLQL